LTNVELLSKEVERSGVTITFLSSVMKCSRNRVYAILKGAECTASEIVKLSSALHLTEEVRDKIFLGKEVN
jgi:plasmid maintenance system antidote protein VapI